MTIESMAKKLRRQAAKRVNRRLQPPKHTLRHRYPFRYRQSERGRVPLTEEDALAMLRWRAARRARNQEAPQQLTQ